jgi:hypothetical protein
MLFNAYKFTALPASHANTNQTPHPKFVMLYHQGFILDQPMEFRRFLEGGLGPCLGGNGSGDVVRGAWGRGRWTDGPYSSQQL